MAEAASEVFLAVRRFFCGVIVLGLLACAGSMLRPSRAVLPAGVRIDRLVVDKSERRMDAYERGVLVTSYPIGTGRGGVGRKRYEGDLRTPEGTYTIDERHPSTESHRFLHVSYPSAADREAHRRGLADGTIPAGREIGGAIGVHGGHQGLRRLFDWTAGCVAVTDREAEDLYRAVVPNAEIVITP